MTTSQFYNTTHAEAAQMFAQFVHDGVSEIGITQKRNMHISEIYVNNCYYSFYKSGNTCLIYLDEGNTSTVLFEKTEEFINHSITA